MLKPLILSALAVIVSSPTVTHAQQDIFLRDRFVIPVNQIDANTFEVIEANGAGGSQLWCAAGIFANKVLRQPRGDIYVEAPRGPARTAPGRKGVVFTTKPVPNAFTSLDGSVRRPGNTKSISHANSICPSRNNTLRVRLSDDRLIRR